MKFSRLALAAALLNMLPLTAQALTSTAPLNVTATTVQPAAVVTVASALAFGTVQDTLTATAQSTFTVTTTNGWPYSIALDGGVNYNAGTAQSFMKDGGGLNPRQYVIYQDAARLNVWGPAGTNMTGLTGTGLAQTYTLYGSLLAAAGTVGAVSDVVTITVTY